MREKLISFSPLLWKECLNGCTFPSSHASRGRHATAPDLSISRQQCQRSVSQPLCSAVQHRETCRLVIHEMEGTRTLCRTVAAEGGPVATQLPVAAEIRNGSRKLDAQQTQKMACFATAQRNEGRRRARQENSRDQRFPVLTHRLR